MANQFTTTDQLKTAALWLAGEPTNGTSDYETQVLNWMQLIYDTLLNGGTIGPRDIAQSAPLYGQLVNIPVTDWKWLRKYPTYAFNTTPAVIGSSSSIPLNQGEQIGTAAVTYGSSTITLSIASTLLSGNLRWRFKPLNQAQGVPNPPITIPRVSGYGGGISVTMDTAWPQESQTFSDFAFFQHEYPLPSDFVRFCESPWVQGGSSYSLRPGRLSVGDSEQVEDQWPIELVSYGPPSAAARVQDNLIAMNRFDTFSYRVEFSYIYTPPALSVGDIVPQEPVVPLRFRHIISLGAAMLIMHDKNDARMDSLSSEFREVLTQMGQEYRKEMQSGSELNGRMLFRAGTNRRRGILRSASGLPLW
jgi:hypothetical protein